MTLQKEIIVMKKKITVILSLLILALLATASFSTADGHSQNIYDIASSNSDFETLTAAVDAADLKGTLEGSGPFTVFAPTDDAFAALAAAGIDPEATLANILLYHVVPGELSAGEVLSAGTLTTAFDGKTFDVSGNAVITTPDGITAKIVATDIEASNGIIHVIDAVIPPPVNALDLSPNGNPELTIAEVAVADGRFNTLVAALDAAGLVSTFASPGNYTVFAPTDDAFAALGEDTINAVLADQELLTSILTYHVVSDELSINRVANSDTLPTLNGQSVDVSFDGGQVMVDGSAIIINNVQASNGVIHVIDAVLIP